MKRLVLSLFVLILSSIMVQAETRKQAEKRLFQDRKRVIQLYNLGKYKQAFILARKILKNSDQALGKQHPDTLKSVNILATLYNTQGQYTLAEPLYKRALVGREKVLGKKHPKTLESVNNLAALYDTLGRYKLAELLYKRALSGFEKVLGKQHPKTLTSVNNLGFLFDIQGRYTLAEPLYKRALAGREKVLGKKHPDTLLSVNNLAALYDAQGRYTLAEPLYKRALAGREKVLGKKHPDTLLSVNNLAALYDFQGQDAFAEPLYKRALIGYEKVLGKEHPKTLTSINNLGFLFDKQSRLTLAEPLYKRVLAGYEKVLGKQHPDTLLSVNNLAVLYSKQGRYALAEPLCKRALAGREKVLGKKHPDTLLSANNLAALYDAQGRYTLAEPLYKRALTGYEKVLGKQHPDTLFSVSNLGFLYYAQQKWDLAFNGFDHSTGGYVKNGHLSRTTILSSNQKTAAQRQSLIFKLFLKTAHRVATQKPKQDKQLAEKSFIRLQMTQGLGASLALSQMAVRFGAGNDQLATLVREQQDLVAKWKQQDIILSKLLGLVQDKQKIDKEQKIRNQLATIKQRITEIDRTFDKDFPDYATLAYTKPISLEGVQANLHLNEALLYFIDTPKQDQTPEETFIWVITKQEITWVRSILGTNKLNKLIKRLRCGLDSAGWEQQRGKVSSCQTLTGRPFNLAAYYKGQADLPFDSDIAYKLYEGLFGKIKHKIKGKKLLLVPSGPLTSLPFQILLSRKPEKGNKFQDMAWLIKEHAITILPSVTSIRALRRNAKVSKAANPFIGFGNPLLVGRNGNDKSAWDKQNCKFKKEPKPILIGGYKVPENIAKYFRGGQVNTALLKRQVPLPETANELCEVAKTLGAKQKSVYLGAKATEATIKNLSKEGVLKQAKVVHFATHGLIAGETQQLLKNKAEPSLLLTPPDNASNIDDGLLTASEITQLKLDADWVILSACNTASGDKPGAEPMSGLAKAFFYAGARALLISHWSVNSDATVALITKSFTTLKQYPSLGRAGALQSAMIALLASKNMSHPEYWAPFILVGEGNS